MEPPRPLVEISTAVFIAKTPGAQRAAGARTVAHRSINGGWRPMAGCETVCTAEFAVELEEGGLRSVAQNAGDKRRLASQRGAMACLSFAESGFDFRKQRCGRRWSGYAIAG